MPAKKKAPRRRRRRRRSKTAPGTFGGVERSVSPPIFVGCYARYASTWGSRASATPSSSLVGSTARPSAMQLAGRRCPSPGRGPRPPASRGRSSCRRSPASPPRAMSQRALQERERLGLADARVEHVEERDVVSPGTRCARAGPRPERLGQALRRARAIAASGAAEHHLDVVLARERLVELVDEHAGVAARAVEVVGEQRLRRGHAPRRAAGPRRRGRSGRRDRRPQARPDARPRGRATSRSRGRQRDDAPPFVDHERAVVEHEGERRGRAARRWPRGGIAAAGDQHHAHARAPRARATASSVRGEIVLSLRSSVPSMSSASEPARAAVTARLPSRPPPARSRRRAGSCPPRPCPRPPSRRRV